MKQNVFTFNISSIVALKIIQRRWLLVKEPARYHLRPYSLVCDHFEVLQGQETGQQKAEIG